MLAIKISLYLVKFSYNNLFAIIIFVLFFFVVYTIIFYLTKEKTIVVICINIVKILIRSFSVDITIIVVTHEQDKMPKDDITLPLYIGSI